MVIFKTYLCGFYLAWWTGKRHLSELCTNINIQGLTYSFVLLEKERMEFDDSVQKQTKNVCYVNEETVGVKCTWVIQQQVIVG